MKNMLEGRKLTLFWRSPMDNKTIKRQRKHLNTLTKAQLVALAVQKEVMPYLIAQGQTKGGLVVALSDVEGVLKPVEA